MGKYSYQVIVTNMKLTPLNTWRFYNGRAAVELIIKELKGRLSFRKNPDKTFLQPTRLISIPSYFLTISSIGSNGSASQWSFKI